MTSPLSLSEPKAQSRRATTAPNFHNVPWRYVSLVREFMLKRPKTRNGFFMQGPLQQDTSCMSRMR